MDIAIPLFDRFTALDAVGPYEVLQRLPGAEVTFVAARAGPGRHRHRPCSASSPTPRFEDLPDPEIVVVPGGTGTRRAARRRAARRLDPRARTRPSQWTTSVCTGSLLLGAAGVLDGLEATTHWLALDDARALRRAARRGAAWSSRARSITAAGVSSGIDMALTLAARIAGDEVAQAIQLGIEYDPQPPFDAGSVDKAPAEIVELVRDVAAART